MHGELGTLLLLLASEQHGFLNQLGADYVKAYEEWPRNGPTRCIRHGGPHCVRLSTPSWTALRLHTLV